MYLRDFKLARAFLSAAVLCFIKQLQLFSRAAILNRLVLNTEISMNSKKIAIPLP